MSKFANIVIENGVFIAYNSVLYIISYSNHIVKLIKHPFYMRCAEIYIFNKIQVLDFAHTFPMGVYNIIS